MNAFPSYLGKERLPSWRLRAVASSLGVDLGHHHDALEDIRFTREQIEEVRYASLLHDFGKIGVREHVLVKAKKLYPHELRAVEDRFELIRTLTALRHALKKTKLLEEHPEADAKALILRQEEDLRRVHRALAKDFPNLGVELYYAGWDETQRVTIEAVAA